MTMVMPPLGETTAKRRRIPLSSFFILSALLSTWLFISWRAWSTRDGVGALQTTSATASALLSSVIRRSNHTPGSNSASRMTLPRVLVIYFPQYHPDPLNDRNWGINFTDWSSLRAAPAKNRYGHSIPRPTEELGYYDLRNTTVRRKQGQLARMHGIDGFIIHHYWFYDKTHPGPNLHAPLLEMLKDGEPNIPFFFNWCAERWTNVWMGRPLFQTIPTSKNRAITLQQQYFNVTDEMIQEHYTWIRQFFHLKNYMRINGQPIFMIYQWHEEAIPILQRLRMLAIQDGFPGLYILSGRSGSHVDLYQMNTDALDDRMKGVIRRKTNPLDQFPMDIINKTVAYPYPLPWINRSLSLPDWCMAPAAVNKSTGISMASREIPGVVPCFDNTPRREFKHSTIWNPDETPDQVVERFSKSMLAALQFDTCCLAHRNAEYAASEDRFVTINAWNEWAEGMSLEPSDVYGRRLLQAIQTAKQKVLREGCSPKALSSSVSNSIKGDPEAASIATASKHFEWKCSDKCSCLPPVRNDTVYMHQSYKTENQSLWHDGWATFRKSWLDQHANDGWTFVFWLDKHNDLLAQCMGYYEKLFQGRSFIQRADLARLLYMYKYGGLYADLDYLALRSQVPLLNEHPLLKNMQVLLQGRDDQEVGFEWGFARRPGHDFFTYCLDNRIGPNGQVSAALYSTGPHMLRRCLKFYSYKTREQRRQQLPHMQPFPKDIVIVEPRLIAPVDGRDFESSCGQWRGRNDTVWQTEWQASSCRKHLVEEKESYAVTFYSQSWNESTR